MSNEESELFGGAAPTSKAKFGEERSPEKTARATAAAMASMDVEGLVGGDPPPATAPGAKPKTLETLFAAPAKSAAPAKGSAKPPAPAKPRAAAAARPAARRAPSKPPTPAARAGATRAAVVPAVAPKKRSLLARLFGWIFAK